MEQLTKKGLKYAMIIMALIAFESQVLAQENKLEGTWHSVKRVIILPDTTVTLTGNDVRLVKIINKTHFATIYQAESIQNSMFNAGKYILAAESYTETLEYFSSQDLIGSAFTYKSKIENNTWTIEGPIQKDGQELPLGKYTRYMRRLNRKCIKNDRYNSPLING
ncbi:MAG TPA: hypothetical protein VEP89_15745 [Draconibacterium sp.]|nr:hypothetical protein [Draconibacterium sp.]